MHSEHSKKDIFRSEASPDILRHIHLLTRRFNTSEAKKFKKKPQVIRERKEKETRNQNRFSIPCSATEIQMKKRKGKKKIL